MSYFAIPKTLRASHDGTLRVRPVRVQRKPSLAARHYTEA